MVGRRVRVIGVVLLIRGSSRRRRGQNGSGIAVKAPDMRHLAVVCARRMGILRRLRTEPAASPGLPAASTGTASETCGYRTIAIDAPVRRARRRSRTSDRPAAIEARGGVDLGVALSSTRRGRRAGEHRRRPARRRSRALAASSSRVCSRARQQRQRGAMQRPPPRGRPGRRVSSELIARAAGPPPPTGRSARRTVAGSAHGPCRSRRRSPGCPSGTGGRSPCPGRCAGRRSVPGAGLVDQRRLDAEIDDLAEARDALAVGISNSACGTAAPPCSDDLDAGLGCRRPPRPS